MAWIDDRIWCHPKYSRLSDKAWRVWAQGCAYSSGFGTRGRLEREHQILVGSNPKVRQELIEWEAWDELGGGAVMIHGWNEHNKKRDDRREADRERKRKARQDADDKADAPPEVPADSPEDIPADEPEEPPQEPTQDGSALKEVTVVTGEGSEGSSSETHPRAVTNPDGTALGFENEVQEQSPEEVRDEIVGSLREAS